MKLLVFLHEFLGIWRWNPRPFELLTKQTVLSEGIRKQIAERRWLLERKR